jgi:hypothetical protein
MFSMRLSRFCSVMARMVKMTLSSVSVMCGFLVVSSFVMFGGLLVVMRGFFVVVCCTAMMFCCLL